MSGWILALRAGPMCARLQATSHGLSAGVGLDDFMSISVGLGTPGTRSHKPMPFPNVRFSRAILGIVGTVSWSWLWLSVLADTVWLSGPSPARENDDG